MQCIMNTLTFLSFVASDQSSEGVLPSQSESVSTPPASSECGDGSLDALHQVRKWLKYILIHCVTYTVVAGFCPFSY